MTIEKKQWEILVDRYLSLKELFIECEETDPALNSNLQLMNEYRHALDHLIRVVAIEKLGSIDHDINPQFDKLLSHIRRAFFDVCDMLAMNYRNKIVDVLNPFDSNIILTAIDNYYSEIRPFIGKMDLRIAEYRLQKGKEGIEEALVAAYKDDVLKLKDFYVYILERLQILEELQFKENAKKASEKKANITGIVIGVIVAVVGIIVGVLVAIYI